MFSSELLDETSHKSYVSIQELYAFCVQWHWYRVMNYFLKMNNEMNILYFICFEQESYLNQSRNFIPSYIYLHEVGDQDMQQQMVC